MTEPDPVFFPSAADFHAWLEAHHEQSPALWVGFYKKNAPQTGITYSEAIDQALAFGWIDGIRKTIDDSRYMIRFTPRKSGSIWSAVNLKRVAELVAAGLMQPAGIKAFEERDQTKAQLYSYEEKNRPLDTAYEQQFRANETAWAFFQSQAMSYQKATNWWVMSAKQEETRQKRLAELIAVSADGRRLPQFTRSK